ncbi:Cullin-1 [Bienertia sinuspersici]
MVILNHHSPVTTTTNTHMCCIIYFISKSYLCSTVLFYICISHPFFPCSHVLPTLGHKNDASLLLTELVAKWSSYQKMAKWLSRFLCYLERYYFPCVGALGLLELAFRCFHNLVNAKFNAKLIPAAMSLRNLLKNIVDYFYTMKSLIEVECMCYDDFEKALLTYSSAYYSQVASHGLLHYSYVDYMYKVEWCLKQEYKRDSHFLNLPLK